MSYVERDWVRCSLRFSNDALLSLYFISRIIWFPISPPFNFLFLWNICAAHPHQYRLTKASEKQTISCKCLYLTGHSHVKVDNPQDYTKVFKDTDSLIQYYSYIVTLNKYSVKVLHIKFSVNTLILVYQ